MKTTGIWMVSIGLFSWRVPLLLAGSLLLVLVYMRNAISEDSRRTRRNRDLNNWLKKSGQLN